MKFRDYSKKVIRVGINIRGGRIHIYETLVADYTDHFYPLRVVKRWDVVNSLLQNVQSIKKLKEKKKKGSIDPVTTTTQKLSNLKPLSSLKVPKTKKQYTLRLNKYLKNKR